MLFEQEISINIYKINTYYIIFNFFVDRNIVVVLWGCLQIYFKAANICTSTGKANFHLKRSVIVLYITFCLFIFIFCFIRLSSVQGRNILAFIWEN